MKIYAKILFRREILNAEGLDAFEESPMRILDAAIYKLLKGDDAEFKQKFQNVEKQRVSFLQELGRRKQQYDQSY